MTHTQGQWQLHSPTQGDPKTGDGTYCITGSHGGVIVKIIPEDSSETPANATLIAAAPAMLKALQAWISLAERSGMDGIDHEVGMTEAAIAKATKEEPDPTYEVKIEAWDIITICAENEDDAQEQAIDHFRNNYVISKVDVEKLESDEEDTE